VHNSSSPPDRSRLAISHTCIRQRSRSDQINRQGVYQQLMPAGPVILPFEWLPSLANLFLSDLARAYLSQQSRYCPSTSNFLSSEDNCAMAIVTGPQVNKEPPAKDVPIYDPTELLSQRMRKWQPPFSLAPHCIVNESKCADNASQFKASCLSRPCRAWSLFS